MEICLMLQKMSTLPIVYPGLNVNHVLTSLTNTKPQGFKNVRRHCPHIPYPVRPHKLPSSILLQKGTLNSYMTLSPHKSLRWYHEKPSLTDLRHSLTSLRNICMALGLTCIAMPKIGNTLPIKQSITQFLGCGRDRLKLQYRQMYDYGRVQ